MRIYTSAPTERAFMTDRHWQTPWHREWVHGKVQPANDNRNLSAWFIIGALVIAGYFAAQIVRWFI